MLQEGIELMAVGMTTVFGFLTLLVVVLQLSARAFSSFGHRWPDPAVAPSRSEATPRALGNVEIAVAFAAVEAHRRQQR